MSSQLFPLQVYSLKAENQNFCLPGHAGGISRGQRSNLIFAPLANKKTMFNKRTKIKDLLTWTPQGQEVTVMGWVRTFRNNQFVALNDGSTNNNLQVVLELGKFDDELLKRITTSASLKVKGTVIESLGKGQKLELKATEVEILGDSDPEKYPLQPKKHSLEFLREIAHLRFRTNTFGAVFRIRHSLAFAIHKFYAAQSFIHRFDKNLCGRFIK